MRERRPGQYVRLSRPDHPLATAQGKVYAHRVVLYDAIGPGAHACHWCGRSVTWGRDLVVDHLNEDRGDNRLDNLVPSCDGCNKGRSNRPMPPRSVCVNGHDLTPENTRESATRRVCVTCRAAALRRYAERRRGHARATAEREFTAEGRIWIRGQQVWEHRDDAHRVTFEGEGA